MIIFLKNILNLLRCGRIYNNDQPTIFVQQDLRILCPPHIINSSNGHIFAGVGGTGSIRREISALRGEYLLNPMGGLLKLGEGVLFQHYHNLHNLHQRSLLEMSKKSGILKMMLREFKPSCLNKEVSDWHRGELLDFLKLTAGVEFPNQGVLIFVIMTILTVSRLDANRMIFIISWKSVATIGIFTTGGRTPVSYSPKDLYVLSTFQQHFPGKTGTLSPSEQAYILSPDTSPHFLWLANNHLPLP